MNRKELAEEIVDFCNEYKILSKNIEKSKILEELEKVSFVENLIHAIILKSTYRKNIDTERLKKLLVALEKERLDLEYDK